MIIMLSQNLFPDKGIGKQGRVWQLTLLIPEKREAETGGLP